jgi:TfoX/Sxy family transcriptional regulator of competence genes
MEDLPFQAWLDAEARSLVAPAATPDAPVGHVDVRSMFGAQCYLVRGKMFAAVGPMGLLLKLPDDVRSALLEAGTASPFSPQPGMTFGTWVAVPADRLETAGREALGELVRHSFQHVLSAGPAPRPARERRHFRKRMY